MYISTLLYYYVNKGSILFYAINLGQKISHGNNRAMKQKSKGNFDNRNLQKLYCALFFFAFDENLILVRDLVMVGAIGA